MKWFGKSWGAPVCDPKDHVDPPEDASCSVCLLPIEPYHQGFVLPRVGLDFEVTEAVYHRNCLLRLIIGR